MATMNSSQQPFMGNRVARIVSFSGIDGAGKTTQIEAACARLRQLGYRVARVTFWDDVAVFPNLRAGVSFRVLRKTDRSHQDAKLRNDKNVRTWYLTVVRACFYLLDSLRLRRIVRRLRSQDSDFIILDRYIYDQAVQVRARNWVAAAYIRLLLALAPKPEFGFILDASPDNAFQRKPEYPLAFMHEYRQAFLELCSFAPELMVIPPGSVEDVQKRIMSHLLLCSPQPIESCGFVGSSGAIRSQ
jgi:thymidylate kinase